MQTPIFYRTEMSAKTDSYSPSSAKPAIMVQHWLDTGAIAQADLHSFEPVARGDLYLVHNPGYVDDVLTGFEQNGFGNYSKDIAASLPYTCGSMLAAARHVLDNGGRACSPSSGFHHAHYASGGGFCTFNGLALAAVMLEMQGANVGILDCDAHYGDGTHDILRHVRSHSQHHTFGKHFPCGKKAEGFTAWLSAALDDLQHCDVVLYQAGADAYEGDPLGGQLSMTAMHLRDQMVFDALPNIAWNLAGGYAVNDDGALGIVARLHDITLSNSNKAHE